MTRISNLAANTSLLQQIFRTRSDLFDLETQIGTGKVSQDYKGIGTDTQRLINLENTRSQLQQYIQNNELMDLRLNIASTAVQGLRDVVSDFRNAVLDYQTSDIKGQTDVKDIQDNAFLSLQSLQSLLNIEVDGRFLFSGARVRTQPVDFGLTSLNDFQSTFDGARVQVSTIRDSHLENFSFNKDSGTTAANWLTFERNVGAVQQVDTITVGGTVEVGDKFTVTINGTAFNFTAASTSANDVAVGLAAAINGGTEPVTAGAPAGGVFTLTADTAGTAFSSAVATTETDGSAADAQTIVTVPTNLNVPGGSRVTATSSEFTNVAVGSTITISGTGGVNDGTFEVIAKTGTTLDIRTEQLTDEPAKAMTISFQDPADSTKTITLNTTLSFTRANNTITRTLGDAITAIPVGAKITIAGSNTNDASFTVKSNDGSNLVVESKRFTDQGTGGAPYFTFTTGATLQFIDGGASADTIVAPAGTFQDASGAALPAGLKLTITGTGANNVTYTIASVSTDKSTVTLVSTDTVTNEGPGAGTVTTTTATGTISSTSYFKGDQVAMTHRVDSNRDFEYDLNAVDPGFEKAIRAMKITLQGVFQTEGGLDQNTDRIEKILFLLNSALDRAPPGGTPPFGTELSSNIEQIERDLGFDRVLIDTTNTLHADLISFLDGSVSKVEDINLTEAITILLNQQLALEASFQVFARIRQLSLSNFLPV
ncbi:MAG: hypothetical protein IIA35_00370 [Proteobacteria bacterium]|nr:hypothetical protein [Pseudomonadota bacterium]